jgi:hypothetical protein
MSSFSHSGASSWRSSRAFVYVFHAVLVAAILSPLLRQPEEDSFPLSPYPMFSRRRTRIMRVTHTVGVDRFGESEPLAPSVSTGAWEALQSSRTMVRAISVGRAYVLCDEAARRVRARAALSHIRLVVIETVTLDAVAYLDGTTRVPLLREEHARCEVVR